MAVEGGPRKGAELRAAGGRRRCGAFLRRTLEAGPERAPGDSWSSEQVGVWGLHSQIPAQEIAGIKAKAGDLDMERELLTSQRQRIEVGHLVLRRCRR